MGLPGVPVVPVMPAVMPVVLDLEQRRLIGLRLPGPDHVSVIPGLIRQGRAGYHGRRQQQTHQGLLNLAMDAYAPGLPTSALPPSREELVEDNLAENCLARLAAAITVPDPGPPVASPGAPQAMRPETVATVAPAEEAPPQFY